MLLKKNVKNFICLLAYIVTKKIKNKDDFILLKTLFQLSASVKFNKQLNQ